MIEQTKEQNLSSVLTKMIDCDKFAKVLQCIVCARSLSEFRCVPSMRPLLRVGVRARSTPLLRVCAREGRSVCHALFLGDAVQNYPSVNCVDVGKEFWISCTEFQIENSNSLNSNWL